MLPLARALVRGGRPVPSTLACSVTTGIRRLPRALSTATATDAPEEGDPTQATQLTSRSGDAPSQTAFKPAVYEFLPHFTHGRERTLEEVAADFIRSRPDFVSKETRHPQYDGNMSYPSRKKNPKVINENPKSPYPIAKLFPEKNDRKFTEYGYQRHMYQQQLRLLRRKFLMEHILQKERKKKLRKLKLEAQERKRQAAIDDGYKERREQIARRHEMRMKERALKRQERKAAKAHYFEVREQQMKAVRQEAIDSLSRLTHNFITPDNFDRRLELALSDDENFDVDVEMPLRKGFDPNTERAEQVLRRLQGQT